MKATNPKIIALLIGIIAIGTASLYLAKFLADYSTETRLNELLSHGKTLLERKNYPEARAKLEECYQTATKRKQKTRANEALLLLARCYTAESDPQKATESWQKILENPAMETHRPEALYTLGQLRAAEGNAEGRKAAEEYYKKVSDTSPGSRFAELADIAVADMVIDRGDLRGARQILDKLKDREAEYPQLRRATFKLNMKTLFSPVVTEVPESQYYVVKEKDTLDAISKKLGTTTDLLEESNGVDPRRLQIGKRLKVVTAKFQLKVSKSKNTLQLLTEDVVLNEYPIGTGKHGSTPVGRFRIADKVKEPPWFKDGRVIPYGDPENVLGTRWMKLESADGQAELVGYGIHGTDDESSIGKESSQGCIRLLNRDVEELFKIVTVGTEVIIGE